MAAAPPEFTNRHGVWLQRALVAIAAVAPYLHALHAPFVFDDNIDILANDAAHHLWPPAWASTSRPVATLTFALNWIISGASPAGFRLVNIILHAAVALALRELVATLASAREPPASVHAHAQALATFSALLWAVHPLHTSAVTYIVHRYEVLASLGYLLALGAVVRASVPGARRWLWSGLACASTALACWSKEIAVTLPLSALLLDRAFLSGSFRRSLARNGVLHGGIAASCIGALVIAVRPAHSQGFGFTMLTPIDYARSQLGVVAHYVRLMFWPTGLCIDYYDWPIARSLGDVMPAGLITIGCMVTAAILLWKFPRVGFVSAWFFVLLTPTTSFLPLANELVAERRLYLALAGPAVLLALALLHATRSPRVAGATVGAAVVALGVTTAARNELYRSTARLLGDTVAKRPANVRARYNYGNALKDEGHPELALAEYRRCIQVDVGFMDSYGNAVRTAGLLGLRDPWRGNEPKDPADATLDKERANTEVAAADQLMARGDRQGAVAALHRAALLDPYLEEPEARLSLLAAFQPTPELRDGTEAVRAGFRAWALNDQKFSPSVALAVGAGLARLGRFDDAIRIVSELRNNAEASGMSELASEAHRQLDLYRKHMQWTPPTDLASPR